MNYRFYVSTGLLTAEHRRRIGAAIWEFEWLISHETREGGRVLNGAPITIKRIANALGQSERATRRNLHKLETEKYITRERGVGGVYQYVIANSKKWATTADKSGQSSGRECPRVRTELASAVAINDRANKEGRNVDSSRQVDKNQTPSGAVLLEQPLHPKRERRTPLPQDFGITDGMRQWAEEHGHSRLEERLEYFVGYAKANGRTYVDWDQAFQNSVRDDWAKLNHRSNGNGNKAQQRQDDAISAGVEAIRQLTMDNRAANHPGGGRG